MSQESSNCGYPMQDVQTGLTKKRKRKKKKRKEKKKKKGKNSPVALWTRRKDQRI
jgi:hypothetical protein